MSRFALAALAAAVLAGGAGCDDRGHVDGARGPCAAGGGFLDEPGVAGATCGEVRTIEDACWKLVRCGVLPVDHADPGGRDWGRCVERLQAYDPLTAEVAIACVAASSCDQLAVNDSPGNPYEWPDCLEYR